MPFPVTPRTNSIRHRCQTEEDRARNTGGELTGKILVYEVDRKTVRVGLEQAPGVADVGGRIGPHDPNSGWRGHA